MAKAGYCDVCGESVWLDGDGSCLKGGHGPEHISAIEGDQTPAEPPPSKKPSERGTKRVALKASLVLGIVLGVLTFCGILTAIMVPAFHTPNNADKIQCFSNQRAILEAQKRFRADGGKDVVTLNDLVSSFKLTTIPKCPSGGEYEWDPVRHEIKCSIHGTVMDQGPAAQQQ